MYFKAICLYVLEQNWLVFEVSFLVTRQKNELPKSLKPLIFHKDINTKCKCCTTKSNSYETNKVQIGLLFLLR